MGPIAARFRRLRRDRADSGFSLVEVMVAIAILGVILSFAYPVYTDYLERSRRTEATEALQDLATRMEQFYFHNKAYTDDLTALGMPETTEKGHYRLSIAPGTSVADTVQTYTLRADAQGGQVADESCRTIQLDWRGTRTPPECWRGR